MPTRIASATYPAKITDRQITTDLGVPRNALGEIERLGQADEPSSEAADSASVTFPLSKARRKRM
jgi:hypothetical protein